MFSLFQKMPHNASTYKIPQPGPVWSALRGEARHDGVALCVQVGLEGGRNVDVLRPRRGEIYVLPVERPTVRQIGVEAIA